MNKKKRDYPLLRDAGKTLTLKTGLKAGAIKLTDILVS